MNLLFRQVANPNNPKIVAIVAIAKNYVKHVKEMGGEEPPKEPVIFQKPFTSSLLVPTGKGVLQLPQHNHEVHHEIELGFVIAKKMVKIYRKNNGKNMQVDITQHLIQQINICRDTSKNKAFHDGFGQRIHGIENQ